MKNSAATLQSLTQTDGLKKRGNASFAKASAGEWATRHRIVRNRRINLSAKEKGDPRAALPDPDVPEWMSVTAFAYHIMSIPPVQRA
ncbi:UNVERIFIED_ORG: hypothetical protein GGI57_005537 [Rhizobium aethiopicum]|uniref:hypothetical protein n=1 Tax=unclassified Rhizobium TaxID=2613769 RepID=UPI000FE0AC3D|nr:MULTISPECIES: hypothetical protein [unclassified Rhizobium]RVU11104.1 hypothetical protein EOS93_09850 [Rhizobium sp. RMa-01]